MTVSEMSVRSGFIVALRLFDIAYEIDLGLAESLWLQRAHKVSSRSRLRATPEKAVAFDVPPLLLTLDPIRLELGNISVTATVTAKLYDFGVVTFAIQVPVTNTSWSHFTALVNALDQTIGPGADTRIWGTLLEHTRSLLASALIRPNSSHLEEDYLLGVVHEWSEPLTAREIEEQINLVPLLSGEQRQLSEAAQRDLLRLRFSYYTDDLVVLTWDRAFIYEPRGDSDIADVLEVANAQLLELRYYDELLDDELPRMHDLVEETQRTGYLLAPRRFGGLARKLYGLVAEVTELKEKVDNALQVTEDVYLARIYAAALELYRVPSVTTAVDRKLAIIRDTYAALYDEASVSRAELLEIMIIILIVAEIVLALVHY